MPCSSYVSPGSTVIFTATPGSGSNLLSWGGACSFNAINNAQSSYTCTVLANSNINVVANFVYGPVVNLIVLPQAVVIAPGNPIAMTAIAYSNSGLSQITFSQNNVVIDTTPKFSTNSYQVEYPYHPNTAGNFLLSATAIDGFNHSGISNSVPIEVLNGSQLPATWDNIPGDVDGDGIVTQYDEDLVLEFAIGSFNLSGAQEQAFVKAADLSGTGQVTVYDAEMIARLAQSNSSLIFTYTGTLPYTITSSPAGINCTNNGLAAGCVDYYPNTTTVTLTAKANKWGIYNWGGAPGCSNNSLTCALMMTNNVSINVHATGNATQS